MRRLIDLVRSQSSPRVAGISVLIALPLVTSGVFAIAVTSLSIRPTIVSSGASATATVTITPSSAATSVQLLSTNTAVARVPTSINIPPQQRSAQFSVSTLSGGCATITASVTGSKQTALIYVRPRVVANTVTLTLAADSVIGGTATSGTVYMASAQVVQLSSSNPNVTVPPTVSLSHLAEDVVSGTFPITTSVVQPPGTCAVITATSSGGVQQRALLRVVPLVQG